jgi:cell division protein ZipA
MLLTLFTLCVIAVLITLVVLHLKRGPNQATRRRAHHEHHEPHLQAEKNEENIDANEALGLQPIIKSRTVKPAAATKAAVIEYITLHVIAPREYPYSGYELLQALLGNGLRYGDKNIFHRHETKTGRGQVLFSLASANKPGTFELTKMGNFTCPGLTLFMVLKREVDPMLAFDTMLETARQLTEDLGGEIWDERRQLLNMDKVAEFRAKIRRFEESQRMPDFFGEEPQLESQVNNGDRS